MFIIFLFHCDWTLFCEFISNLIHLFRGLKYFISFGAEGLQIEHSNEFNFNCQNYLMVKWLKTNNTDLSQIIPADLKFWIWLAVRTRPALLCWYQTQHPAAWNNSCFFPHLPQIITAIGQIILYCPLVGKWEITDRKYIQQSEKRKSLRIKSYEKIHSDETVKLGKLGVDSRNTRTDSPKVCVLSPLIISL